MFFFAAACEGKSRFENCILEVFGADEVSNLTCEKFERRHICCVFRFSGSFEQIIISRGGRRVHPSWREGLDTNRSDSQEAGSSPKGSDRSCSRLDSFTTVLKLPGQTQDRVFTRQFKATVNKYLLPLGCGTRAYVKNLFYDKQSALVCIEFKMSDSPT